jgi:hypothetical protein
VPSILGATALTTLQTVLDELSLTSDGGGVRDQRVERFINVASEWIRDYCGRELHRGGVVEGVKAYGRPTIRLSRTPIVSITSIVVDGTELDDYSIEDAVRGRVYRSAGWPWTAAARGGITTPQVPGWETGSRIVAVYVGGWVTPKQAADTAGDPDPLERDLPWQVEDACVRLVASRWRGRGTDGSVISEAGQNVGVTFEPSAVPRAVLAALAPYRRHPTA